MGGVETTKPALGGLFGVVAIVATVHARTLWHVRLHLQVHLSAARLNCCSAVSTMREKSSCTHSTTLRQDL